MGGNVHLLHNTHANVAFLVCSAISHGVSHLVGSIEVGKVADLVAFDPAFFGTKPSLVLKSGIIAWGDMGTCYLCIGK